MKNDKLLMASIIGGLSTIAGEIVTKILVLLHIGKYAVYELNSLIITANIPSLLIGFIINIVVGSFVGAAFYLLFIKLGAEHLVIKCTICSLFLWLMFEVTLTLLVVGIYIDVRPISDHFVHLAGTAAFGVTLGVFLKLFLFRNKQEPKDDPELQKPA